MRYVVEVNEARVHATPSGIEWWMAFRKRGPAERFRDLPPYSPFGSAVQVSCDGKEHAGDLAAHMVSHGSLPRTAVRVKRVSE